MIDSLTSALGDVRTRTRELVAGISDEDLRAQHSPLMSPMVWDLAHIANYEEQWLVRALDPARTVAPELDDLYDAFRHPRRDRPSLPLLGPRDAEEYAVRVRHETLAVLGSLTEADLSPAGAPWGTADHDHPRRWRDALVAGGFVYGMVVQHEHQHDETLLATRQLMGEQAPAVPGVTSEPPRGTPPDRTEVRLPGGVLLRGTSDHPWAYDNERPVHAIDVEPFWIDTTPVTNDAYQGFVDAGGYDEPMWWSRDGWAWRLEAGLHAPQFWDGATVLRFGRRHGRRPDEPVQHVCWYEAEAYAHWVGKRLPTEAEWEYAARVHPDGRTRRYPWGDDEPTERHANLGQRHDGPAAVGAYPAGANPWGVLGLIGDVWEWTASAFDAYPGFASFPYREYSEVFFGPAMSDRPDRDRYRVLRGGSWAAHPTAVRATFRNWDHPIRRQIFCGFRCARDGS
jgi:iron(II)-dependent oxidoreductase